MLYSDSLHPSAPHDLLEKEVLSLGYSSVCGIDEAGRGPWAGPVVAAAVILQLDRVPSGLNDSKKLTPAKREALFEQITEQALWAIGIADEAVIDAKNILGATLIAMADAVARLKIAPDFALVDGNRAPLLVCPVRTVIQGDGISLSIAAASIIAKVTRDRIMQEMDQKYPGYGFAQHKGYGTALHQKALREKGITPHHRRSFAPIKKFIKY